MKKFIVFVSFVVLFSIVGPLHGQALTDIENHWAKNEIQSLEEQGIINGYNDGTFRAYTNVTRGQFAAFLVRALNLPEGTSSFVDVTKGNTLYKEITAAKKAGILKGTQDGKALAGEEVTRADVAVMVDRALQYKGSYTKESALSFKDAGSIPKYAFEAFKHTVYYGIVKGTDENKLEHSKIANRGESAVFIYRLLDIVGASDPVPPNDNGVPGESVNISSSEVGVQLGDGNTVRLKMNNSGVPLKYINKRIITHIRSKDYQYNYYMGNSSNPLGKVKLTFRRIDNGDTFVFARFDHFGNNDYTASIIMPFENMNSYSVQKYSDYGDVVHTHDDTVGDDPTTTPIGLVNLTNSSNQIQQLMLSKNYTSFVREKQYANGQKSTLRELAGEWESYHISQDETSHSIEVKLNMKVKSKAVSESWALLSNQKLFQKQEYIDYWFKRSIDEYLSINKWLTADGTYSKLPWSIEPGYKLGYGRNLGHMQGGIYLKAYKGSGEPYFYDLVMDSIADLDVFSNGALTAGQVPIFKTEYTSTWLKNAYGTTAPYIDTRHNENTALFLKDSGDIFNIPQLKEANLKYAGFLIKQEEIGNIIPVTKTTHLIADYYAPGGKTTHVSLNHSLGEMRFLLETYLQTGDDSYYKTARQIKGAIEYLYPRWVRDNGDLWYQVNGQMQFTGGDYDTLTLVDLLLSQQLFEDMKIPRSSIFDQMITTKTKYLVGIKYPLKGNIVQMLRDQGFGDLVKDYGNVSTAESLEKDTLDLLAE
ncbi:S-layer homology domain-containing protein [Falsibacillus pallidus]|uniref:S-layer family protein n=1 Tax=Falsibacillus pallidus TaxID=493781 RepID=A0A370GAD1_9BACI|nr:S-layer homology domain-containing protein [Falsibacillus pallidus]RDI39989.1 S-layer family protein [Falsibacillus pallidus]